MRLPPASFSSLAAAVLSLAAAPRVSGETTKERTLQDSGPIASAELSSTMNPGGGGYRFKIPQGDTHIPVVVVGGTPYQRGWHFGKLIRPEAQQFLPAVLAGFKKELGIDDTTLDQVWSLTAAYTDDRFEQELAGVAAGVQLPLRSLQHLHCLPLLMPYSCSSIAAWGSATEDGHLYQTRNLDWTLKAGAHEFPVLLVEMPDKGEPHVLPTFAGVIGANCGMNASGIVLSEIGDSPASEMPYTVQAPHFTSWFRTLLQDATTLSSAVETFQQLPQTKRYHFVFGDGRQEKRAVKIRAHSTPRPDEQIQIWKDQDPADELAPNTLTCVVYHDEGRGAFPTLQSQTGKLNGPRLVELANQIPIRGGNVLNAVFDATGRRLWVSYAHGDKEAYQRPYAHLDLTTLKNNAHDLPAFEARGGRGR